MTDTFWKVYAEAAADQNPTSEEEVLDLARRLVGREDAIGGDRHANYRRARDVFASAGAREYVRRTLDGMYHFHNGWNRLGGNRMRPPLRTGPRRNLNWTGLGMNW